MHGFSTVDGFVEISESLAGMIKYLANEPSVGLYFVQQHTQKQVPNVMKHKKNVVEKSHETSLHAEDLEDSITMVRSMKECGFPIAEEMIGDIRKSLVTMATKPAKRGLIHQSSSTSQTERESSSWGSFSFYSQESSEKSGNYFSSVFMSARQKSRNLMRPQLGVSRSMDSKLKPTQQYQNPPLSTTSASTASSLQGMETDEVPQSSQVKDDSDIGDKLLSVSEKYRDFKAIKEAQLEKWLEGTSNHDDDGQADDAERI